jgi:hypothetical protein
MRLDSERDILTESAILETLGNLKSPIDDAKIACGIFLDFSKALDTIDRRILLEELYKYGIRSLRHEWFSSHVTNHRQHVIIGNVETSFKTITRGVPQGSTLPPLISCLYINDLLRQSYINLDITSLSIHSDSFIIHLYIHI